MACNVSIFEDANININKEIYSKLDTELSNTAKTYKLKIFTKIEKRMRKNKHVPLELTLTLCK